MLGYQYIHKVKTCISIMGRLTLRKKCQYSELFWSAFSRIRTECGKILSEILKYWIWRDTKMRTRITPNTDTFHAVQLLNVVSCWTWSYVSNHGVIIHFFKKNCSKREILLKQQNLKIYLKTESVYRRCSLKTVVFKNFENFTGKHLCWTLFWPALY